VEFIAAITQHIPDKSFQMVRCPRCGYEMKIISLINHTTFDRADFDPPSVIRSSDYWSTNTDAY